MIIFIFAISVLQNKIIINLLDLYYEIAILCLILELFIFFLPIFHQNSLALLVSRIESNSDS